MSGETETAQSKKAPSQAERLAVLETSVGSISKNMEALGPAFAEQLQAFTDKIEQRFSSDAKNHPSGAREYGDAIDVTGIEMHRSGDPIDLMIADYDPDSDRFKEFMEDQAFFEEPVWISVPPKREQHDFAYMPVFVNGLCFPLVRGQTCKVPRFVVEQLYRSGVSKFTCDLSNYDERLQGGFRYHETFAVPADTPVVKDSKKGYTWLAALIEQEREAYRPTL